MIDADVIKTEHPTVAWGEGKQYYQLVQRTDQVATYRSTPFAQGAWRATEQHMAPVSGIMALELSRFNRREAMMLSRLGFEILGVIPAGEFSIECRTLRPGRNIELVEATLTSTDGRPAVIGRAWRMATSNTSDVMGIEDSTMPPMAGMEPWTLGTNWGGGFVQSISGFIAPGARPGLGRVWARTPIPLTLDTDIPDLVRHLGMIDVANGVGSRALSSEIMFPNVDLQIHLYRHPKGEWLGLDTRQSFGPHGIGVTSSVLHDQHGPYGRAEQSLLVRTLS